MNGKQIFDAFEDLNPALIAMADRENFQRHPRRRTLAAAAVLILLAGSGLWLHHWRQPQPEEPVLQEPRGIRWLESGDVTLQASTPQDAAEQLPRAYGEQLKALYDVEDYAIVDWKMDRLRPDNQALTGSFRIRVRPEPEHRPTVLHYALVCGEDNLWRLEALAEKPVDLPPAENPGLQAAATQVTPYGMLLQIDQAGGTVYGKQKLAPGFSLTRQSEPVLARRSFLWPDWQSEGNAIPAEGKSTWAVRWDADGPLEPGKYELIVEVRDCWNGDYTTNVLTVPVEIPTGKPRAVTALTEEQIAAVNEAFGQEDSPIRSFLTSRYARPRNLHFAWFLEDLPGSLPVTGWAERQAVEAQARWKPGVRAKKYPRALVDEVLTQYAGITTGDLETADYPFYLEDYDSFYTFGSACSQGSFHCIGGEQEGDEVRLYGEEEDILILQKVEATYKICSHLGCIHP